MKFLDLFAGIGGFRLGMEAAGHECVGFCEIDKFARMSYKAIHGLTEENEYTEWEWHNVRSLSNKSIRKLQRRVGKIDVICGGFPCQSFSIAGKRRGFDETRGTLFFEIARTASILKPKYLFLENVKGLLNHAGGDTFETVLRTLDELGYNCEWQLLNSKDFGVPQNREHVFIIGHLRGSSGRAIFPIASYSSKIDEGRIIASTITARYSTSQREGSYIATDGQIKKYRQLEGKRFNQMNRVAIIQKPRGYNKGGE
ncbi:MAG TPA: DNA (cytosine-5-)-methyltransferase, partial [Lactococcus sp.]|nr:DNA (cytosine-5-)-methyltransferase [Lactococcus sp.]